MSIWDRWKRKPTPQEPARPKKADPRDRWSSTSRYRYPEAGKDKLQKPIILEIPTFEEYELVAAGDSAVETITFDQALETFGQDGTVLKESFTLGQGAIADDLFAWYSSQSFIGYQACAIISQNWLVNKALSMPAEDAVRNGFEIATDDGTAIDPRTLSELRVADRKFNLAHHLVEFERNRRRFGFRIAIFVVESDDKDYYRKPFNIDGVTPGSYKGITQVDPNWIAPILDAEAAANPISGRFYEPTWWMIGGIMYHHTHLIISRYVDPPDILKPSYQYGGIPLTQLILERVYAAERTANEAPMLVETKRLNVAFVDIAAVAANPQKFEERLNQLIYYRNNYGVHTMGLEDKFEQQETSLAELPQVIEGQYNIVAGIAGVPATKLMGTSPTGFASTGEFEIKSYGQLLESIQTGLTPLIERHHELLVKSEEVSFANGTFDTVVVWHPVSSPDAKELSEINLAKANTDSILVLTGAIDANDVRKRLIGDAKSGYAGIEDYTDEEFDDKRLGGLPGVDEDGNPIDVEGEEGGEEPTLEEESMSAGQVTAIAGIAESVATGALPKAAAEALLNATYAFEDGVAAGILASIVEGSREPETSAEPVDTGDESDGGSEPPVAETDAMDKHVLGYVSITPTHDTAAMLQRWTQDAGIDRGPHTSDYHMTLAHSTQNMPTYTADRSEYEINFTGEIGMLGEDPQALVWFVESEYVRQRFDELQTDGAEHKFPEFIPHITIKYDPDPGDLEKAQAAFQENPLASVSMGDERVGVS